MKNWFIWFLVSFLLFQNAVYAAEIITFDDINTAKSPIIEYLNEKDETNIVRLVDGKAILLKGTKVKIAFAEEITSKNLKIGDKIPFCLNEALKTKQGTLLLPADTKIIATVENLETPKSFNRSAKIYLSIGELILPNGQSYNISAKVNSKNGVLKRSGWNIFAKISEWTVGLLGVGAGAGAAIGAGASAASVGCLAIGLPIGAALGLIIGSVTPGVNYHVKAGKEIKILLVDDLEITLTENL